MAWRRGWVRAGGQRRAARLAISGRHHGGNGVLRTQWVSDAQDGMIAPASLDKRAEPPC